MESYNKLKESIYYQAKLKALEGALTDSSEFFYRKVTRWYSKTFHTPLIEARKLPYMHILQEYFEEQAEALEHNELFEIVTSQMLPEFIVLKESEDEAYAQSLIDEQKRTLERKRKKQEKDTKKQQSLKPKPKEMNLSFDDSD